MYRGFLPVHGHQSSKYISPSVVSRYLVTITGGEIYKGGEWVEFGRLALSVPENMLVRSELPLVGGSYQMVGFSVEYEHLKIVVNDQPLFVSLAMFDGRVAVRVDFSDGENVVLKNVLIYVGQDLSDVGLG